MRRQVLWSSVLKLLDPGEELVDVAYMWQRRPIVIPFAALAGVVVGVVAVVVAGFAGAAGVALGLAAATIGGTAATDYSVLAWTSRGLVLMGGGRIRQVAKAPIERLNSDTEVVLVGNNFVISDWLVGGEQFSVLRRFQATMTRIADEFPR